MIESPALENGFQLSPARGYGAIVIMIGIAFFSPPLFFIERYSLFAINKVALATLIGVLFIVLVRKIVIPLSAIQLGYVVFAQAMLLLWFPFLHQEFGYAFDSGYFNLSFQVLAGLAIFLILASSNTSKLFAEFWVNLHLVIGACGICIFIAGLAWNLEPRAVFSDRPYFDFGLAYTNVFYQVGDLKLIRVAGFYDEPGTFAFNMTFALIMGRIYGVKIWKERLLILFGLTSLSMVFIFISALWVLMTLNRKTVAYITIAAGSLLVAYSQASIEVREAIAAVTTDRFSVTQSGDRLLRGDNRTEIMKDNYRAFLDAPIIGHGLHYQEYVGDVYRFSFIGNPIAPLAINGIVGSVVANSHVFCFFILLYMSNALRMRDKLLVALLTFVILAQKPWTINGLGYLVILVMTYRLLGARDGRAAPAKVIGKSVGP